MRFLLRRTKDIAFPTTIALVAHLRSFQVDRVKIDQSFTMGIGEVSGSSQIIQAIIDLAQSHGLKITAEGVESTGQEQFLRWVGCDALQGFRMSRPLPVGDVDALLGFDRRRRKLRLAV